MTDPLKQKQEFFAINGLRFAAAFWVLVFHTSLHFGNLPQLAWIQPVINQGPLAMTLFFMLSGFVLSYRYRSFASGSDIRTYTAARLARLYPVYAFMGVITLWAIPSKAHTFALYANYGWPGKILFLAFLVVLFLLAIQAWFPAFFPVNIWNFGGSWSLSVEAFFYSLFPWLRNRVGGLSVGQLTTCLGAMLLASAGITAGMLASQINGEQASSIFYVLPVFRLPEFVIGIVGFVLFIDRHVSRTWLYASGVVLGIILLGAMYARDLPGWIDYGWLAAIPFLAAFVASTKVNAPKPIKVAINYCGRISYCLYMAQFTTVPVLKMFRLEISLGEAWFLSIGGALLLAGVTYHLVEVLAYQRTRQLSLALQEKLSSLLAR